MSFLLLLTVFLNWCCSGCVGLAPCAPTASLQQQRGTPWLESLGAHKTAMDATVGDDHFLGTMSPIFSGLVHFSRLSYDDNACMRCTAEHLLRGAVSRDLDDLVPFELFDVLRRMGLQADSAEACVDKKLDVRSKGMG